ncbi:MAG: hypothetical protein GY703_04185 [Gammaproteobacteria bacterium]|nr:hypothetical protein [Gammaproteobacteria bacterium]
MFANKTGSQLAALLFLLSSGLTLPVSGANFVWLNDAPIRYFTDEDWTMMEQKADEVLNEGEDGREYAWKNPQSGNSGSFVAEPATGKGLQNQRCRQLTIVNRAKSTSSSATYDFCRQEDGKWLIAR